MSLKRANYLCGHQSCDNKKCTVRLSRELTRAVCHVLEKGHRDSLRKERLLSHVTEAGEDIPDLPDLATLDLPLIEDSSTTIVLSGGKLEGIEEMNRNDTRKGVKVMRENESSDGVVLESSINSAKSNRWSSPRKAVGFDETRTKSTPQSTYGQCSDYLKYGGMELLDMQTSSKVKTSKKEITLSKVESRNTGSSRLTNVYGESCSSTVPESHTARMDFLKYQNKKNSTKHDETLKNQLEEPVIIESKRRSGSARSNSKKESIANPGEHKKSLKPERTVPDPMDGMVVLFQYNSSRLSLPKFQVQDILSVDKKYAGLVETITQTGNVQKKIPSVWDACTSEDSDAPVYEEPCRIEVRSHQHMPQRPTDACVMTKNASFSFNLRHKGLATIPESSLRSSDPEDTCVRRNLMNENTSSTPKKIPESHSARKPLPSIQEVEASVGRNLSEFSTRNLSKIQTPTPPQTTTKPADVVAPKSITAEASSTRHVSSRPSSGVPPSATKSITEEVKSRTTSGTSKTATDSTSKVPRSRTPSAESTASGRAAGSSTKCIKSRQSSSTTPNAAAASIARVSKSRIPIPAGKLVAGVARISIPTTPKRVVDISQTSSAIARPDVNSHTKILKDRQSSQASTKSETPAVSTTKVGRNGPSSVVFNTSTDNKILCGRRPSTESTKSKTSLISTTKLVKSRPPSAASNTTTDNTVLRSRRPSTESTKSKTSLISTTKLVKSRPPSAASNTTTDNTVLRCRRPSTASTKSKTSLISTTKLVKSRPPSAASNTSTDNTVLRSRRPSTASTKSKTSLISTTKLVKSRPPSAASNTSTDNTVLRSRRPSTSSTISKSSTISTSKVVKSKPSSAASNSSTDHKALKSRQPSTASTISKPDTDTATRVDQTNAPSAVNPSRITNPVETGSRPIRSGQVSNVAGKVDCRRPMTAVVDRLSPNVKLVEQRCRPQSSGNEVQVKTSSKPRLARPSSELKREPIQMRLGSKTPSVEGENVEAVRKPVKLATNQSPDENIAPPTVQGNATLKRSFHTNTSCKGRAIDRTSSKSSSGSKDGVLQRLESGLQTSLVPNQASKIPLPLNPVSRERLTLRDKKISSRSKEEEPSDSNSSAAVKKTNIPSIYHVFDEMLQEKVLTASEKAGLLKMNQAMMKAGKLKPVRAETTPKASKGNLGKENTELEVKMKEILPPERLSKVSVRNKISMFDTINDSMTSGATGNAAQKDELLEDDYASFLELDNTESIIESRQLKNSLTASMVEFARDRTTQQVARKLGGSKEQTLKLQQNASRDSLNES